MEIDWYGNAVALFTVCVMDESLGTNLKRSSVSESQSAILHLDANKINQKMSSSKSANSMGKVGGKCVYANVKGKFSEILRTLSNLLF